MTLFFQAVQLHRWFSAEGRFTSLLFLFHQDLVPPTKLTQCLQKPSGTKLAERYRQDGGRGAQENDPVLQQSKGELALKIKTDPDKPNPGRSLWHPNPCIHGNQGFDLHRVLAKQENTTSVSPPLNNSFIPTSSSPHPSISSTSSASPPKIYQKLQVSSPTSFHPLPSFSSSFLCPLPTSSFSSTLHGLPPSASSLHPLPSSSCSLPSTSTAGGRKGRVCCGVCGKSFYDKGRNMIASIREGLLIFCLWVPQGLNQGTLLVLCLQVL